MTQEEQRRKGELGFGGSIPCAQTKGLEHQTFYYEGQHPEELLRLGHYDHMPILMGANSHEGSYVYGGNYTILIIVIIDQCSAKPQSTSGFRFIHILALYNQFILPNELDKDTDFLKYQFTDLLLRSLGVEQEYAFSDLITAKYFHEDQLGNITAMTAGAIDVRSIL